MSKDFSDCKKEVLEVLFSSLKGLSEKCGLSLSILCGMANGTHPPAKDRYSRIAAVLNWEAWQ